MDRPRVREFGIRMGHMETGSLNAITDVDGVGVGHYTLIKGDDIRTGVTAIQPHQGNVFERKVTAAVDLFNAYGKTTGIPQIIYEGVLETPIILTETLNVWRAADALVDYFQERFDMEPKSINPVVGETNGSYLTDNLSRPLGKLEVFKAMDIANCIKGMGSVPEGNVGGGTPMTGYGFKGGIGTSSRVYKDTKVGVLVQLNCGRKDDLLIDGLPIGREVEDINPKPSKGNSIMMIVATDLDLTSRRLWKVAKRAALGLARTGSYSSNGSGDFTLAFSTGKKSLTQLSDKDIETGAVSVDQFLSPIYKATVEATEEAIINALFKAETMVGYEGNVRYALPLDQVREVFERHNYELDPS